MLIRRERPNGTPDPKFLSKHLDDHLEKGPPMTKAPNRLASLLHRLGIAGPALLCAVAGLLAFTTAPALAGEVHVYNSAIGGPGSGAGEFEDPAGVAVNDATGDVYVVDKGNNRIDEFDPSKSASEQFVRAWGWGVGTGLGGFEECTEVLGCKAGVAGAGAGQLDAPEQIAVDNSGSASDPSNGDVYVTNTADNVIDKFSSEGAYLGEIAGTCEQVKEPAPECKGSSFNRFTALYGVGVDSAGALWVSRNGIGKQVVVDSYSDVLVNVLFSTRSSQLDNSSGGPAPGFAVDSEDDLFVAHASIRPVFARLDSSGELLHEPGDPPSPGNLQGEDIGGNQEGDSGNGSKTGVAVDLADDDVYLDMVGNAGQPIAGQNNFDVTDVEELAADGETIEEFGSAQLSDRGGSGVGVNSATGTVYVADDVGGKVWVYTTIPTPNVTTGAASDLQTEGAATLNGKINPDGELKECKFEYFSEKAFAENFKNEVQTVTVAAEGGRYILIFKGEKTEPIGYHAPPGGVRSFLEKLPSIGTGNVEVTGAEGGPYKIEFKEKLAHAKLPALTAESSFAEEPLEPATATVTAAIVTLGGDGYEVAKTAACEEPDATEIGTSDSEVPVHADVSGLTPDSLYKYRLEARNENGETKGKEYRTFVAPARPAITGESVSGVGSSTVTLSAQLNPGGALTSYRVEYGPSEAYGSSTPLVSAGAGLTATPVRVSLSGLAGETLYYARIVADNEVAVAQGLPVTFTTGAAGGASVSALPDDRADELVSYFPLGTDAEAYVPTIDTEFVGEEEHGIHTALPFAVAPDGEAVVYPGDPPPTGGTGNVGEGAGNEYLATRSAQGWEASDIQPAGDSGAGYEAFSSDLSVGILGAKQSVLGGGTGEYNDLYAHAIAGGAGGEYDPFYTGTPPNRPAGEFGGVTPDTLVGGGVGGLGWAGGNAGTGAVPAFSHLLFEANDALPTANVAAAGGAGEDPASQLPFAHEDNLYDSTGGGLYLVNVLPDGATEAGASFGQFPAGSPEDPHGVSNAISGDGSRIFWTALEGPEARSRALYVRENDTSPGAVTVQVDASQDGPESGGGEFWTASSDGSKVFFTDCRKLTADSTAVPTPDCAEHREGADVIPATGSDLYEYEVSAETGQPGRLTDLTVDQNVGETADVQGVLGSGENGEYVYFAADGVLAGANAEGRQPISGQPNLYLSHAGATTFIATLSTEDGVSVPPLASGCNTASDVEGCEGDWQADPGRRTAEVTPAGQGLVFMSNQRLTGYPNDGLEEVFLYEAQAQTLRCVSCNPSGAAPVPVKGKGQIGGFIPTSRSQAGEQPRVISEDGGRVFFDSGEPLVSTDTNGWLDVYEWERDGEGTCTDAHGCTYDLSGGTEPEDSYLLGSDASGDNAFFISRADLAPADYGRDGDVVYDARVDGIVPPVASACEGTGCQGVPPTPPIFATPASGTATGIGNFPAPLPSVVVKKTTKKTVKCKRGFTKKKNKCVKTKTKKKAKKASRDRRTSR